MKRTSSLTSACLAALTLAGCAGTIPQADAPRPPKSGTRPVKRAKAPVPPRTNTPIQVTPVYGVAPGAGPAEFMGQDAAYLTRIFGNPALDVKEGTGRKLQFQGQGCVLDAYLYPPAQGQAAVVVEMEARDRQMRDVEVSGCAAALRQR